MNIHDPIESAFELLNQQLEVHNIKVVKSFDPQVPYILGDTNQLQQIFVNLLTNARDAIYEAHRPEGGEIFVATALNPEKDKVVITVGDNGTGILEQELHNIFNPFYTTKCPNRGIGLGLSIVYRIIENHAGTIIAASTMGEGTTFTITLPIARTEAAVL
jgi:signal transduction histidine kinase